MLDRDAIGILQVALAHEERARAFYERMAAVHGTEPAGDLFAFLAREEQGHIDRLAALHGVPRFEASWEADRLPPLADMERVAWEQGAGEPREPGPDALRRGLELAAAAERAAISFYVHAGRAAEDREAQDLCAQLEAEERMHLARIEGFLGDPAGPGAPPR